MEWWNGGWFYPIFQYSILHDYLYIKEIYTYDENNNLIALNKYGSDNALISRENNKYSETNKLIEKVTYNQDGTVLQKNTVTYDEKDNIIKSIFSGNYEMELSCEYEYWD